MPFSQAFEHTCEPVHGGQAGPLVKQRPIAANSITKAYAGRVVTLDSNGNFQVGNGGSKWAMPMFLIRGIESPSVYTEGNQWWQPAPSASVGIAAVATGGFELQSTEFNTSGTYAPNTPLTADSDGVLTPISGTTGLNTYWVVGICSVYENQENYRPVPTMLPVGKNANGKDVLTFWSVFLPADNK